MAMTVTISRGRRGRLAGIVAIAAFTGLACSAESGTTSDQAASAAPGDTISAGNTISAAGTTAAPPAPDTGLSPRQRETLEASALPEGMDIGLIERGRRIFLGPGNCHVCHAPDGKGARGVGADLTDAEWWNGDGSWRAIVETIESGVPSEDSHNEWGAMMPVRGGTDIDDDQVRAVAAYVWSLRLI